MNKIVHLLMTLLMIVGSALVISGVFCAIQWLASLVNICGAPTFGRFMYGSVGLAVLFVLLGLGGVIKHFRGQR